MRTDVPPTAIRAAVALPMQLPDDTVTTGRVFTFDGLVDGKEHLAIGLGTRRQSPLVRLHSECLTGDVFGRRRCDCGPQLHESVHRISAVGGYLLYLRQEGRGIGLYNKLDAYVLQDLGLDTYEANLALGHKEDERDYTVAAQMLAALGVDSVMLLGNNPDKADQLRRLGIAVLDRMPTAVHLNESNGRYLAAKATRGLHSLDLAEQHAASRGDQRLAGGIENQHRDAVTLHLRSAFPLGLPGPSQAQVFQAGQALPCFTRRTQPPRRESARLADLASFRPATGSDLRRSQGAPEPGACR